MKWYVTVVSVCIFLVISDAEPLFVCPLAVSMASLEKCLLRSFAHFKWVIYLSVAELSECFTCSGC